MSDLIKNSLKKQESNNIMYKIYEFTFQETKVMESKFSLSEEKYER